jgi:hypothetical protein
MAGAVVLAAIAIGYAHQSDLSLRPGLDLGAQPKAMGGCCSLAVAGPPTGGSVDRICDDGRVGMEDDSPRVGPASALTGSDPRDGFAPPRAPDAGRSEGPALRQRDSPTRPVAFQVHPDGSITGPPPAGLAAPSAAAGGESVRYDFGLPDAPPATQSLEGEALPICQSQWERGGIRYTQVVLVTRLGPGDLAPQLGGAADAVLLVRVSGENVTSEYADATAAFALRLTGQSPDLELEDGLVQVRSAGGSRLVALVDVATSGIASPSGSPLRFRGNMPPGISGAMVIKIPCGEVTGEPALNRLRDLEFDEEWRRVKKFWTTHQGGVAAAPVRLAAPTK